MKHITLTVYSSTTNSNLPLTLNIDHIVSMSNNFLKKLPENELIESGTAIKIITGENFYVTQSRVEIINLIEELYGKKESPLPPKLEFEDNPLKR